MSVASSSSKTSKTYSVNSYETVSLSANTGSWNADDVSRKVTQMQLLKKLSKTHAAAKTKTSVLLAARGKSTAQSIAPALAAMSSSPVVEPLVRAGALYTLSLLLCNHSMTKMNQNIIEKITPVLVNSALVANPAHTRAELEMNNEDIDRGVTTKRKSGWINSNCWANQSSNEEFMKSEKLYRRGMRRVDGSANAILRMLRAEKKKQRNNLQAVIDAGGKKGKDAVVMDDGDEGDQLIMVKSGKDTVMASSVLSPEKVNGKSGTDNDNLNGDQNESYCEDNNDRYTGENDGDKSDDDDDDDKSDDDNLSRNTEAAIIEDKAPLSVFSIRRAGLIGLIALLRNLKNSGSEQENDASMKMFVLSGGVDALLLLSYYRFSDDLDGRSCDIVMNDSGTRSQLSTNPLIANSTTITPSANSNLDVPPLSARSATSTSTSLTSSSIFSSSIASSTVTNTKSSSKKRSMKSLMKKQSVNDGSDMFFPPQDDHRQYVNVFLQYQATQRNDTASSNISRIEEDEDSSVYYRDVMKTDDSVFSNLKSKTTVSLEQRAAQLQAIEHLADVNESTEICNSSLSLLNSSDLKRLLVTRTASLRSFLDKSHPSDWMFEVDCEPFNFFGGWVTTPQQNVRSAGGGLYWFVDSPLSELYEKKNRNSKKWKKKMKSAREMQKAGAKQKKDGSLDLRRRLAAAKAEAEGETARGLLESEKKAERRRKEMEEEERQEQLEHMKDLARSTKILVASLKADGVNVEEYFKRIEIEERKEELQRQIDMMSQASNSTVEPSLASNRSNENAGDGLGMVETELQRRDRLKEESKKAKESEESNAVLREELERKRIEIINEEEANRKKNEKKVAALKKKEDREYILTRMRELKTMEKKKEIAETKLQSERKKHFDKYFNKIQRKVEKVERDRRNEERHREDREEKRRIAWKAEEDEKERLKEEEEFERKRKEEEKEEKRKAEIEAIRKKKQEAINEKKKMFANLNVLADQRLAEGCTWLRDKNGDLKFYDRVEWPEEALKLRETYGLVKEVEVIEVTTEADEGGENNNESAVDEAKIEEDVTRKTGIAAGSSGGKGGGESEWIAMEDKAGKRYLYNQVRDEMKYESEDEKGN